MDQTPRFVVAKRVYDTKQAKGGVIVELYDIRKEAVIDWDGQEQRGLGNWTIWVGIPLIN